MGDWPLVRLGDVADDVTVGHVGPMVDEYRVSGLPFLRSQNVQPHTLELSDVKYIDRDFHARLSKSSLHPGDVVIVRTGKPGTAAVIPEWLPEANCADLVIVRPGPRIDARWLSYYINAAAGHYISTRLVGAVQQHFNVGAARVLEFELPTKDEQRRQAAILCTLDDKIAANLGLAATASQVVIGVAASAEGVLELGHAIQNPRATVDPESLGDQPVSLYSLPAFDAGRGPERVEASSIKSAKWLLSRPCVLVSKLNPRFPRIWAVDEIGPEPMLASTEFVVLEPKTVSPSVLRALLLQPSFSSALEARVAGTSGSHQRVKPADMLAVEIADPSSLPERAHAQIDALAARAWSAAKENAILIELRDTLLPALMSGRLRVRDAERAIEAVV